MNFSTTSRYIKAIDLIDQENSKDSNIEQENNLDYPKELLYSKRMTAILNAYKADAGELVHLAARGQHIRRWAIPRTDFPEGKQGYHQWRNELTDLHCRVLSEIMEKSGYNKDEISIVEAILKKKNLKTDKDSQILQDVVSLTFLKFYALEFAGKYSDKNIGEILQKVVRKMSETAIIEAKKISPAPIVEALNNVIN